VGARVGHLKDVEHLVVVIRVIKRLPIVVVSGVSG
jgi:predicted TIM-barrel enzyme